MSGINRLLSALFLMIPLLGSAHSQPDGPREDPITNFEWLESIIDSAYLELRNQSVFGRDERVQVEIHSHDALFRSVQKTLLNQRVLADGNIIAGNQSDKTLPYKKLALRWLEWSVNYLPIKELGDVYERNLKAGFLVEVFEYPGDEPIFVHRFDYKLKDVLSRRQIDGVGNDQLPFTLAQRSTIDGGISPLWQKVFLFAISGTVVYLFYSIRTQ